jgi:psp operon transcriptional activator
MQDRSKQLVGESPPWLTALEHASRVAPLDRSVLVIGERGTGKELIGERLHFLSKRWEGPFVKVNCAALSETLLDSELFGHERGAFTGATEMRRGRFELADGGTIFLDEIATAGEALQEKLLRVVEYGEFQRVGGSKVLTTNVRIVAATNGDLPSLAEAGKFRWDLLDRLSFDVITLPPLRVRTEDIGVLADHFGRKYAELNGVDERMLTPAARAKLLAHHWRGNVRELENVIERLVILRGGNEILPEDLPAKIFRSNPLATHHFKTLFELPDPGVDLKQILSDIEDSLIMQAMTRTRGNKNQASKLLALNRTTLIEKMKKNNLEL